MMTLVWAYISGDIPPPPGDIPGAYMFSTQYRMEAQPIADYFFFQNIHTC
jgi:hypothetical protein